MADPSGNPDTPTSAATETSPAKSSTTASTQPQTCAQCAKSPDTLKQCLKCHSVSYCGKDCQKAHFKSHKKVCASLAQEYVKANEPKMASRSSTSARGARDKGLQKWQFDT
ncbi:hypothetical protein FB567DRAFT_525393 [Paraphoma chrysanthemicola]|uniref:MYND-type domain-containing protein n=1 Tax=Paraphoma chrysanthemicola TaxID=798071 RepID=A0A8K0R6M7_9PLEO|nr:hypothetical protein FB567DRAFT_525393 [Paraphoma chrysanthemicola]